MIDRKLEKLTRYIEEIDALSSHDLCIQGMQTIPETIDESLLKDTAISFKKELSSLIQNAKKDQIDENFLIKILYENMRSLLRKKMIYTYAEQLGIERGLYKHEMNLLFKGKIK